MPMGLQHSHVWDPGPSFPTCPRLRTAPSQTLFEQLSMKVALSLARARSTRCTRSDWNWDPFLIYDLIYWICSLNFIDFQPMIEKTNWTIGSLPKDDAFTAIFWIWIWWHIKIILQASECHVHICFMSYIMMQLHEKYNNCLLTSQFDPRYIHMWVYYIYMQHAYHDFANDIRRVGAVHVAPCSTWTCEGIPWTRSQEWQVSPKIHWRLRPLMLGWPITIVEIRKHCSRMFQNIVEHICTCMLMQIAIGILLALNPIANSVLPIRSTLVCTICWQKLRALAG